MSGLHLGGEDLARAVLGAKDRYALLSLGADVELKVDSEGFLNLDDSDVRKAYFKISQKIHPDKLPHYSDATRAFQACVRAYELICKPELRANESDDSRDEEEVGDKDDDVDAERKDCGAASKKPRKPSKTRQPTDETKPGKGPKKGKEKKKKEKRADQAKKAKVGKKKWARLSRASSSSSDQEGDDFIDDEENSHGWGSSSSADDDEEEGDEDLDNFVRREAEKPKLATLKKPRSNENCFRTAVTCPKCRAEWGQHLKAEGQEASYSLFMQGLRQVHCLRCLFEFGALTAGHKCPLCNKAFSYMPAMYNRKIKHKQCKGTFGIYNFEMSKSKESEELAKVVSQEAHRRRKEEAAAARAARARGKADDEDEFDMELGQFIVTEDCPYCGEQFTCGHGEHLQKCRKKAGKAGRHKAGGASSSSSVRARKVEPSSNGGGHAAGAKAQKSGKEGKKGTGGKASKATLKATGKATGKSKPTRKNLESESEDDEHSYSEDATDSDFHSFSLSSISGARGRPKKRVKSSAAKAPRGRSGNAKRGRRDSGGVRGGSQGGASVAKATAASGIRGGGGRGGRGSKSPASAGRGGKAKGKPAKRRKGSDDEGVSSDEDWSP